MPLHQLRSNVLAIHKCRWREKRHEIRTYQPSGTQSLLLFAWITGRLSWLHIQTTHLLPDYVANDFKLDLSIGFSHDALELHPSCFNMLSVIEHSQVVSEYLEELSSQHVLLINSSATCDP